LPKTERKGREMRRKAEKWGKGTKRNKRNKQAAKRNEARTKPNKFDLIALSERQKGGEGEMQENRGKWGNGNPSVIAMACGVLWRLFFNGLMLPPNKYKTIRMQRRHLELAANFSLCVSYFFLHPHKRIKSQASMTPDEVSTSITNLHLQLLELKL